jgi:DNA (cytosine-5)-methyltransferase 1
MNHPNRVPQGPQSNPSAAAIRAARESAQLSQTDAAALIHASLGAWQKWEQGDRRMHPAFWELFRIKTEFVTV